MTVGLDATYSLGDEISGVGVYSRELLLGLATAYPNVRFACYYRPHRYFRSWTDPLPPNCRRRVLLDAVAPRSDLFHGLNQRLPKARLRHAVATFHDLFVMTGDYSTPEFRARFTAQARDAAARAEAIIAVSAFTAKHVVELLNVDSRKIHVVHHGVRSLAYPPVQREKVILSAGAIQIRKNIPRLVEAFETVGSDWRLVLAGSRGYGSEKILRRIEASSARPRIQVLGYVSPDQLAEWYSRAMIFAFPSLDEGFGMPVLEAMAAGVPVLTSDRSAMPEVAGNAAALVNPEDTQAIASTLRALTLNEELRSEYGRRGAVRVRDFTWEKAVRKTWDVYSHLNG